MKIIPKEEHPIKVHSGPCPPPFLYKPGRNKRTTHTYLDDIDPFNSLGLWATEALHSTATLSIQSASVVCIGSGLCIVSIFPRPASATLAERASFLSGCGPNPNLRALL
ncbi:hypothetical protein B0H34DRAFT_384969 [Crassisporium funariophilum]|nr:hypothetical protein B0H34DRAFT_384969 [Crassisporium funariophilum]